MNPPLTTTRHAHSAYLLAMRHVCSTGTPPIHHLRDALDRDVHLAVATADLAALADNATPPALGHARRATRWERQHIEIVRAAEDGDGGRAEALLRDHVHEFGCDPIALLAVTTRLGPQSLVDLRETHCACLWSTNA
jgi:DNA-binding GntR family transcriptional regulator